ncbi:MAG: cyclic nucleotide-binding domain-containing protein [Halieaceae bacterium]
MNLPINFLISEIPLFDALDFDELKEIEKRLVYKELRQGTVIYKQGSEGRSVCFVVDGELSVVRRSDKGDATIATVSKGQSVGEMAIIDGLTRSADVVATSNTCVLILKREDFDSVVSEYPHVGVKVLKSLARGMSVTLRDRSEDLARLMLI